MSNEKNSWTADEMKRLQGFKDEGVSAKIIAHRLARGVNSVNNMLRRLKSGARKVVDGAVKSGPKSQISPLTSHEADSQRADGKHWETSYRLLAAKYERALKANSAVNQLVAEVKSLAPLSYAAAPSILRTRKGGAQTAQSALLLFSDTHIGKVVEPSQTLNMGEYNFPLFLARLKYLEESCTSIIQNHTIAKVDELVVCMLGDMLDGALSHGVEAGQRNTLFSQYYMGAHATAQFLRALATVVPKVRVQTVVGNHTRWQNQRRMPTENRFSNLDQFMYSLVQALVSDIKTIDFQLDAQPFKVFEVQGHVFQASHGDHLRGGDGGMGIPSRAYSREISSRSQLFAKNGQKPIEYFLSGHLHREISMPHTMGSALVNGAFVGLDNFGLAENFSAVDPSQRLVFVHPKHGLTAEYGLNLKWAEVTDKSPYTLPPGFPME